MIDKKVFEALSHCAEDWREYAEDMQAEIESLTAELAAANQRAEAAESALADLKRDTGHSPDYVPGMHKDPYDDCPPSGILQEWQPWNGK